MDIQKPRRPSDDDRRISAQECLERMAQALVLSGEADPERGRQYAEIADMWRAMAASMHRYGLNGLEALRREKASGGRGLGVIR